MIFTPFQKKILTNIYQYNPKGTDCIFKDLLTFILNKNFKNAGILVEKNKPIKLSLESFDSSKFLFLKHQLQELFFLLNHLNKTKLLIYIKTDLSSQENFIYGNFLEKESRQINLDIEIINKIYYNLYSDFYVSSSLKESIKKKFKTIEDRNLNRTLWALWISIIVASFQMGLNFYIAKNIPVSIEFQHDQEITVIKNNDIFSKRINYNGFFNKN